MLVKMENALEDDAFSLASPRYQERVSLATYQTPENTYLLRPRTRQPDAAKTSFYYTELQRGLFNCCSSFDNASKPVLTECWVG